MTVSVPTSPLEKIRSPAAEVYAVASACNFPGCTLAAAAGGHDCRSYCRCCYDYYYSGERRGYKANSLLLPAAEPNFCPSVQALAVCSTGGGSPRRRATMATAGGRREDVGLRAIDLFPCANSLAVYRTAARLSATLLMAGWASVCMPKSSRQQWRRPMMLIQRRRKKRHERFL